MAPSTFALVWVVNFLQYLVFYLLVTTMTLYAARAFAASDAAAGFASSAFVAGATIARLFSGHLVDTMGRRQMMLVSLVVVLVSCAAYLPAQSLWLLILVRLVHGLGYAFASTALMTIVQSAFPAGRRAEGTGYFALASTLATAVGPALGLFVVNSFGYRMLFLGCLATSLLSLLVSLPVRPEEPTAHPQGHRPRFSLRAIAHPAVVPIGCFMLLIGVCYAGVITYLNAYSEQSGLRRGASLFFLAYAVSMLVMRFVLGKLQDRRGDNLVVYLGIVAFALALSLLGTADADWQVVFAGGLTGLGYGTLMPACQAIAVRLVDPHQLGTGISTLLLLADVGIGLGPVLLGLVIQATDHPTMYLLLSAAVLVAAVLYHFVHGRLPVAQPAPRG